MNFHQDIVDGWTISIREDGSFGVGDGHGMVAGPFGDRTQAIAAALKLPKNHEKPMASGSSPPDLRDVEPGSDADAVDP